MPGRQRSRRPWRRVSEHAEGRRPATRSRAGRWSWSREDYERIVDAGLVEGERMLYIRRSLDSRWVLSRVFKSVLRDFWPPNRCATRSVLQAASRRREDEVGGVAPLQGIGRQELGSREGH